MEKNMTYEEKLKNAYNMTLQEIKIELEERQLNPRFISRKKSSYKSYCDKYLNTKASKEEFDYLRSTLRNAYSLKENSLLKRYQESFLAFIKKPGDYGLIPKDTRKYYEEYCSYAEKVKYEEIMLNRRKEKLQAKNKITNVLEQIENSDNIENIINLLIENDVDPIKLRYNLFDFLIARYDYSEERQNNIKSKLDICIATIRQREKDKEFKEEMAKLIPRSIEIITEFVSSKIFTKKEFCNIKKIKLAEFESYVSIVKDNNEDLYLKYNSKIELHKKQRFSIMNEKISRLVTYITNGITEKDNTTREFEILDYYQYTNLELNEFLKHLPEDLSKSDYIKIKKFVENNSSKALINIKTELEGKTIILKNGEEYIVPSEKKYSTIEYLNNHNIPLYNKVYKQALRRNINNKLIEKEETSKIK